MNFQLATAILNGTTNVPGLAFGDCVKDENLLSSHPGKVIFIHAEKYWFQC